MVLLEPLGRLDRVLSLPNNIVRQVGQGPFSTKHTPMGSHKRMNSADFPPLGEQFPPKFPRMVRSIPFKMSSLGFGGRVKSQNFSIFLDCSRLPWMGKFSAHRILPKNLVGKSLPHTLTTKTSDFLQLFCGGCVKISVLTCPR